MKTRWLTEELPLKTVDGDGESLVKGKDLLLAAAINECSMR